MTSQILTGSTLDVSLSNPQNWTYVTDDLSVSLAGSLCTIISGTLENFQCTLPTNSDGSPILSAGEWFVKVQVVS